MVNLERSMLADLNIFVTIVRRQSIKQAANELGVTTSAISHRLRKLEADLGVRLLNRTSRSIKPTLAGKAFAEQFAASQDDFWDRLLEVCDVPRIPIVG